MVNEMTSEEPSPDELRKKLYTYWHELDFFVEVESTNIEQVRQSEIKWFIIKYIRDGIEDDFGKEHNLSRRHAFSAKELHEAYTNSPAGENCSISNFHFHIQSLVEHDYLREIATIKEGRHITKYYGRTSIAFLDQFDQHLQSRMAQDFFEPLKRVISAMNPDLKFEHISQLVDNNLSSMRDYFSRVISWIEANYPHLYKSKIDLHTFMTIAAHYSFFHKDLKKSSKEIASLLDLDRIMKYERYELS
jgi:hypothetical protein